MHKLGLALIVVGLSLALIYWRLRPAPTQPPLPGAITQDWQYAASQAVSPADFKRHYTLEHLIQGEVASYDQHSGRLSIKQHLPGLNRYQDFSLILPPQQTVFCWPRYQDQVDVTQAYMEIQPGNLIYLKGEQAVIIEQLAATLSGKFVFLQTDEADRFVKLAVVECDAK